MQQIYKNTFEGLPDTSKVWVYQSQTPISEADQVNIQLKLDAFIREWAAHGEKLFGDAKILNNYHIVIAVDEGKTAASGCSIDTSVNFIKSIGHEYGLIFFDRLHVLIQENNRFRIIHFSDLQEHQGAIYFDNTVSTLADFRTKWVSVI